MKDFDELTYLGRVRRMRKLAAAALVAYGLGEAHFRLLRQAGNTLYRVSGPASLLTGPADDLFQPGQYLLRIHQPDYQEIEGIELELAWLHAMRQEAQLPVPEPVPALDGRLLIQVSVPGVPGERNCSLLRWVKGRSLANDARPHHYRAQGLLMARMHNFATQWQSPPGLTKRQYDRDGLFSNDSGTGIPASEAWNLLPERYLEPCQIVAQRVRHLMDGLGKGPEVYGLIHADLGVDANLLFWRGEARPIDFDDSGFGYWVYDLAVALEHCREEAEYDRFRAALLDAYAEIRPLPDEQVEHLELFTAALDVYISLWAVAAAEVWPLYRETALSRLEWTGSQVVKYVSV
jgi:Ser/Thr protein kinase RdoA (MazF antagonist)